MWRVAALWGAAVLSAALLAGGYLHWRVHRFDELASKAGSVHGVDPQLVLAVIRRESDFRPRAVGKAGEIGLMQVTESAALEWAKSTGNISFRKMHLFVPETNVLAGTWYLAQALQRWRNKTDPLPYALAEYNAGRSNARRWAARDGGNSGRFISGITYPATRSYIESILADYRSRCGAAYPLSAPFGLAVPH